MSEHLAVLTTYFNLVDTLETDPAAYEAVLHPEVVQTEYPNALNKTLQERSLTDILDNLRVGRELLQTQQFTIDNTQVCDDGSVRVEGQWRATVASEIGAFARGQNLSAQLCLVFEFKEGRIFRQHRYACFDPFWP